MLVQVMEIFGFHFSVSLILLRSKMAWIQHLSQKFFYPCTPAVKMPVLISVYLWVEKSQQGKSSKQRLHFLFCCCYIKGQNNIMRSSENLKYANMGNCYLTLAVYFPVLTCQVQEDSILQKNANFQVFAVSSTFRFCLFLMK